MLKRNGAIGFFGLAALFFSGNAFSQNNIVLFDVPEAVITYPVAINTAGTIVGYWSQRQPPSSPRLGFIRDAGGTITLFNAPGGVYTSPAGINYWGTIAGTYFDGSSSHGFLRDASGNYTVFDSPGSTDTQVTGINDFDEVVGIGIRLTLTSATPTDPSP
jgi:hypothetical protein